jgi:citrate synthase
MAMSNGAAPPLVHPLKAGLEDVIVSTSGICFIDGHKGRLLYRGYDVDDLVAHSSFEEVVYLPRSEYTGQTDLTYVPRSER